MQFFPADTTHKLEFGKVLDILSERCLSSLGQWRIERQGFIHDKEELHIVLSRVKEFVQLYNEGIKFPQQGYADIREELDLLKVENYIFSEEHFMQLREMLTTVRDIFNFFKNQDEEEFTALRSVIEDLHYEKSLLADIDKVLDENGKVKSNASPALQKIRKNLVAKRIELDKVFKKLLQQYRSKGHLSDTLESIRNGRRVLSVVAESKRSIGGIIHDESDSGRTYFIEPDATVKINNDIFELERDERREIQKILKELTTAFRAQRYLLVDYQELLAEFDLIQAKAGLARGINGVMPQLSAKPTVHVKEAYHPLLLLHNKKLGKKTIPLTAEINEENRLILISGPNAGGKSVCLKTIGLLQLMLQWGLLVPVAPDSEIGIFEQLFTDIGDSQSIEDELSTYSSRLRNNRHFLKNADAKTLLLIDEFGTGTDPSLGGAVAEAILGSLLETNCKGVVTTHYSNLKVFAEKADGIVNAAMIFDEESLRPTYQLQIGQPGSSYTFVIAGQSGLPKKVVHKARQLADTGQYKYDELLSNVEQEKKQLEQQIARLEKEDRRLKELMRKFEQQNQELEFQRKKLKLEQKEAKQYELQKLDSEIRKVLKQIEKSKEPEKEAKQIQQQLQQQKKETTKGLEELKQDVHYKPIKAKIEVGMEVKLPESEQIGKVEEIRKNKAVVSFGMIKSQIPLNELIPVETKGKLDKKKKATHQYIAPKTELKIDLRGKRVDEALAELESFLDQALINNLSEVSILHGKGTGALRKVIKQALRQNKHVSEFSHPTEEFGGDGITIVKFE